jgi:DNA polymerase I-like protein with 3'-5' exonuclease and polymerase domains
MIWRDRDIEIKVWKGQKLKQLIAVDTETEVKPFHLTPDIVTCQAYDGGSTVYYVRISDLYRFFNKHDESTFIFHNAAFDLDVLSKQLDRLSYTLLDECRARDTSILYRLWHLGHVGFVPHKYSLAMLTEKYLNETLDKNEDIRGTFEQFKGKPISEIPDAWLDYGARDVLATFDLYLVLMGMVDRIDDHDTLLSHDIQIKGDLALNHIRKNGIGIDLKTKDEILSELDAQLEGAADVLATWGWVRGLKGLQQRYEQALEYAGIKDLLPRTANGDVSSKSDDLKEFAGNPFVDAYMEYHEVEKTRSFIVNLNSDIVHPRYNCLLNTGRTSCSSPNVQQLPRKGDVRRVFIPTQKDCVFGIVDYSSIELSGLAQVCYSMFGESKMRELINDGKCLHYHTASAVYEKPEAEITKDERQFAKIPNFGFGANMSPSTFTDYCRGYGVEITEQRAAEVKDKWVSTYPEMRKFFSTGNNEHNFTLTGRKRANCTYTAYLNTCFQGLCADGLKLAMYELDKTGFRIALECHDEIVCELPKHNAEKKLQEMQDIMVREMQKVIPDVRVSVEGDLHECYTK